MLPGLAFGGSVAQLLWEDGALHFVELGGVAGADSLGLESEELVDCVISPSIKLLLAFWIVLELSKEALRWFINSVRYNIFPGLALTLTSSVKSTRLRQTKGRQVSRDAMVFLSSVMLED